MDELDPLPALDRDDYRRYGRHLALPEVGETGQRRLKAASVLLVGTGGLGSPIALYLAAAGIGRITLTDFDVVELSNLQRQIAFDTADVGRPKVQAAAERLRRMNPSIAVEAFDGEVDSSNVRELVRAHDVVVDGTDNFATRYLVSDACVLERRPMVYGSIFRFEGQVSVFCGSDEAPCYRCLFPEPPPEGLVPNCAQAGVLGVLPGLIGCLQATEVLKLVTGVGLSLSGRLLLVDAKDTGMREVRLRRDPGCRACGPDSNLSELVATGGYLCPTQASTETDLALSSQDVEAQLASAKPPSIVDVREAWEYRAGSIPGALHVPYDEAAERLLAEFSADTPVVLVCSTGPRAVLVAERVRGDRPAVRVLEGGLRAWRDTVDPDLIVP